MYSIFLCTMYIHSYIIGEDLFHDKSMGAIHPQSEIVLHFDLSYLAIPLLKNEELIE